jgi:hypothetical protein
MELGAHVQYGVVIHRLADIRMFLRLQYFSVEPYFVITYPTNSYCSQANSLKQYTTVQVCHVMMVVWQKHVVAMTSEEEKKNCCIDGPLIA